MSSFDEEWAQLQADARDQLARTRLNTSEGAGAGPGGELSADWNAKRAAADYLERDVLPDVVTSGQKPVSELEHAAHRMTGWDSAAGLRTVTEKWLGKVNTLGGQLRSEVDALRGVASGFEGLEVETAFQMRTIGDGTESFRLPGFE